MSINVYEDLVARDDYSDVELDSLKYYSASKLLDDWKELNWFNLSAIELVNFGRQGYFFKDSVVGEYNGCQIMLKNGEKMDKWSMLPLYSMNTGEEMFTDEGVPVFQGSVFGNVPEGFRLFHMLWLPKPPEEDDFFGFLRDWGKTIIGGISTVVGAINPIAGAAVGGALGLGYGIASSFDDYEEKVKQYQANGVQEAYLLVPQKNVFVFRNWASFLKDQTDLPYGLFLDVYMEAVGMSAEKANYFAANPAYWCLYQFKDWKMGLLPVGTRK